MSNVKHPYQGHIMEGDFLAFVIFAARDLMPQYKKECEPVSQGDDALQEFIDWCVVQFGTPDQIGGGAAND